MKTVHHLAKGLGKDFEIPAIEALAYIEFVFEHISDQLRNRHVPAINLPYVGTFILNRSKAQQQINACKEKLAELANPERYRNVTAEHRQRYVEVYIKRLEGWQSLKELLDNHYKKLSEIYDKKMVRYLARKALRDKAAPEAQNGIPGNHGNDSLPDIQKAVTRDADKAVPMDLPEIDYL